MTQSGLASLFGPGGGSGALSYAAGNLGANFSIPTTLTPFLTTARLAAGTWKIEFGATVTGSGIGDITAALGTATGSLSGMYSSEVNLPSSATASLSLRFIAVITTAGTLQFEAIRISGGLNILAATSGGYPNATGYTAVKIG